MQRSKILKLAKVKYFFTLLAQRVFLVILAVDKTVLNRIVVDLHLKKLSYNEIREHIRLIYHLDITKHRIKDILVKAGNRAQKVNRQLDREICSKIRIIETDEEFQGKTRVFLGAAEKFSQYLLKLKPSPDRTSESISTFLSSISKQYTNIRVVISDMFNTYKGVIPNLFRKARHLVCHVHVQRDSMRKIEKIRTSWKSELKSLENTTKTLEKTRKKISKLMAQQKEFGEKLAKDRQTLKDLIRVRNKSTSGKTKVVDTRISAAKKRIQRRIEKISEIKDSLPKARKKREDLRGQVRKLDKQSKKKYQIYMQSSRIQANFFLLLKEMGLRFTDKYKKFMDSLGSSNYGYAEHLLKQIKNNPKIFSLRKSTDLAWNYQNTNTIERIFGIFRPRLDSSRLFQTDKGAEQYCDLFRLYYNTTPRYTGIHNDICPFEQLGGNLHNKNYLDLVFPVKNRVCVFLHDESSKLKKSKSLVLAGARKGAYICA